MKQTKSINIRIILLFLMLYIGHYCAIAQTNIDSTNSVVTNKKESNFINLSASLRLGKEIGFIGGIEYENYKWGKVMLRPELAYIGTQNYLLHGAILDIGFGYGYPIFKKEAHTLFLNGYLTWYYSGLFSWADGQSAIIELEYRKKRKKRCFVIAPYFRYAATNQFISTYRAFDYSFGIRIGFTWQYPLKLKSNK